MRRIEPPQWMLTAREPNRGEFWAAFGLLAFFACATVPGLRQFSTFDDLTSVTAIGKWVWQVIALVLGIFQLWVWWVDNRRLRRIGTVIGAMLWTFLGTALLLRNGVYPCIFGYFLMAMINLDSVVFLRGTQRDDG